MKNCLVICFAIGLTSNSYASKVHEYDAKSLALLNALAHCPDHFRNAASDGLTVAYAEMAASRPPYAGVDIKSYTVVFSGKGSSVDHQSATKELTIKEKRDFTVTPPLVTYICD